MASFQNGTVRDRTSEFLAIAERLQKQQGGASTSGAADSGALPSAKQVLQQKSDFAKKASEIAMGIHKTSAKLKKLAQLAKSTSNFNDPAQQINELTGVIKQDIQALNSAIAELQSISARSKDGNSQSQSHSHTVVDNLRTRLKDATKEFKDVLTKRTENLKGQDTRRKLYSAAAENGFSETQPLLNKASADGPVSAHALFGGPSGAQGMEGPSTSGSRVHNSYGVNRGVVHSSYDPYPGSHPSVRARSGAKTNHNLNQQQQQMQLANPQDTYLASRSEALHNVESTIVELGGIFQQLAHMVAEQGEMALRIDENVDDTKTNLDNATTQLLKYLNSISSNRWLIMKIFFVLMLFLVIFVVFIA